MYLVACSPERVFAHGPCHPTWWKAQHVAPWPQHLPLHRYCYCHGTGGELRGGLSSPSAATGWAEAGPAPGPSLSPEPPRGSGEGAGMLVPGLWGTWEGPVARSAGFAMARVLPDPWPLGVIQPQAHGRLNIRKMGLGGARVSGPCLPLVNKAVPFPPRGQGLPEPTHK
ncbi:hypothetical protein H1C71_011790 [Ictidomys tridecemlineatus]|nr:hypothetical protein H1C71_011790 [Ictidomys tridecemlineatus]KAG3288304.1 hypothetical protein H1C71_011790 [Ictidomys tridecemlineatus]KAG3288305.1 hypothetical protein H1C71_011790 [Ictidomys tridecemlineatus]KAG3288306.1 hypothetical protein H1C71_011790 [Ictidomys tridecemlineatus]